MASILKTVKNFVWRKRQPCTHNSKTYQHHGQLSLESFELRSVRNSSWSDQEKDSAVDELGFNCSSESMTCFVAHELPLDQSTLELAQALAAKCVHHFFAPSEKLLFDLMHQAPEQTSEALEIVQELAVKCEQMFAKWAEPEPKRVSWRDQSLFPTQAGSSGRRLSDVQTIPSRHDDPQFSIDWDVELRNLCSDNPTTPMTTFPTTLPPLTSLPTYMLYAPYTFSPTELATTTHLRHSMQRQHTKVVTQSVAAALVLNHHHIVTSRKTLPESDRWHLACNIATVQALRLFGLGYGSQTDLFSAHTFVQLALRADAMLLDIMTYSIDLDQWMDAIDFDTDTAEFSVIDLDYLLDLAQCSDEIVSGDGVHVLTIESDEERAQLEASVRPQIAQMCAFKEQMQTYLAPLAPGSAVVGPVPDKAAEAGSSCSDDKCVDWEIGDECATESG